MAQSKKTAISEGSHPHIFQAYPALRQRAAEKDGVVILDESTLREFETNSRFKGAPAFEPVGRPSATTQATGGPVTDAELNAAIDEHFRLKRDPKAAAAAKESPFAKLSARDPLGAAGGSPYLAAKFAAIGRPPRIEVSQADLDAHAAVRREARAQFRF